MERVHIGQQGAYLDIPAAFSTAERDVYTTYVQNALTDTKSDKAKILSKLPLTGQSSAAPISTLSTLLTFIPGPWPVFDLQCCYARAWKHLPEHIKAGTVCSESALVHHVEGLVRNSYSDMLSLLPTTSSPAVKDMGAILSHKSLTTFVRNFSLPTSHTDKFRPRVALALPNGPLLGLALICTTVYYTACPLSVASGPEQFKSDLSQSEAKFVFVLASDVKRLGLDTPWVEEAGIEVIVVEPQSDLTFTMRTSSGLTAPPAIFESQRHLNGPDDVALMLFTSGTSGTKKTVPITVHSLVAGIAFVIESWGLKSDDVCLNMMPLFHV